MSSLQVSRDQSARRAVLKDHLADLRWKLETGGIVFNGTAIGTEREVYGMISGRLQVPGSFPFDMKTKDGSFITVDKVTLEGVAAAIVAHVQGAFNIEKTIVAQIDADTVTDLAGVDATWLAAQV